MPSRVMLSFVERLFSMECTGLCVQGASARGREGINESISKANKCKFMEFLLSESETRVTRCTFSTPAGALNSTSA